VNANLFICVDWGTTRLRASLCDAGTGGPRELDARAGPGVLASKGQIEETLFTAIEPWLSDRAAIPLLLAGMVGSNIGWRNLKYLPCPVYPSEIVGQCVTFESRGHPVTMVPGLECVNDLGNPDVMRGEELQVLGWLDDDPEHRIGPRVVCLPGTHTKWVFVDDGRIVSFRTAITGEMYSLLARHSVLLAVDSVPDNDSDFDSDAFAAGVYAAAKDGAAIMHLLFSVRSRMLKGLLTPEAAPSYLSGMLIGADCATAIGQDRRWKHEVAIVGEPGLCRRFSIALGRLGVKNSVLDGRLASLNGFMSIFRELQQGDNRMTATQ